MHIALSLYVMNKLQPAIGIAVPFTQPPHHNWRIVSHLNVVLYTFVDLDTNVCTVKHVEIFPSEKRAYIFMRTPACLELFEKVKLQTESTQK